MGRNYDTDELNELLAEEGFKGDIPEEIEICDEQIEFANFDENWELEGTYDASK